MTTQKSYGKEFFIALIAAFTIGTFTGAALGFIVFFAIGFYVSRNDPAFELIDDDSDDDSFESTTLDYNHSHSPSDINSYYND